MLLLMQKKKRKQQIPWYFLIPSFIYKVSSSSYLLQSISFQSLGINCPMASSSTIQCNNVANSSSASELCSPQANSSTETSFCVSKQKGNNEKCAVPVLVQAVALCPATLWHSRAYRFHGPFWPLILLPVASGIPVKKQDVQLVFQSLQNEVSWNADVQCLQLLRIFSASSMHLQFKCGN